MWGTIRGGHGHPDQGANGCSDPAHGGGAEGYLVIGSWQPPFRGRQQHPAPDGGRGNGPDADAVDGNRWHRHQGDLADRPVAL